ncbi:F-box domain [Arabidopsis suecica]|uniref:F-box domain n=1 Tax=Arabidopsis suecica TaxID=45249 RepID=A0A8T2AJU8_ARASU|nr:F-box domain [Arabidopsis suecica]
MTTMISDLPRDLIEDILSRLSWKSMKAVRLTCKSWNNLSKSEMYIGKSTREGQSMMIAMMPHNLYLMSCVVDDVDPSIEHKVNMDMGEKEEERTQWQLVAEKVEKDLVLGYERAKTEMEEHHHVLRLVARFGKIIFYGRQARTEAECSRNNSKKMFSTDVPTSYLQHITFKVVPSHGFSMDLEKERYTVKVSHSSRPNATINCKCTMKEDGRLSGLRWPFGKALTKDGYREFEVCHVRATIYKNKTLRLRVRETDRFNERSGTGEIKREVSLTLKDIDTKLQEQNMERACVVEMLRDALGTIWDFLHCDAYFT